MILRKPFAVAICAALLFATTGCSGETSSISTKDFSQKIEATKIDQISLNKVETTDPKTKQTLDGINNLLQVITVDPTNCGERVIKGAYSLVEDNTDASSIAVFNSPVTDPNLLVIFLTSSKNPQTEVEKQALEKCKSSIITINNVASQSTITEVPLNGSYQDVATDAVATDAMASFIGGQQNHLVDIALTLKGGGQLIVQASNKDRAQKVMDGVIEALGLRSHQEHSGDN